MYFTSQEFLQISQDTRLHGCFQHFLVLDAFKIPLRDRNIFMSHDPGKRVQIQSILQLHVREGVAQSVGRDTNLVIDTHIFCRLLQKLGDGFRRQLLSSARNEIILFGQLCAFKIVLACRSVVKQQLCQISLLLMIVTVFWIGLLIAVSFLVLWSIRDLLMFGLGLFLSLPCDYIIAKLTSK